MGNEIIAFKNLDEYKTYLKDVHPTKIYSLKEVELLNPSKIDNGKFWEESYNKFGPYIYSPANPNKRSDEIIDRANWLHSSLNTFSIIDSIRFGAKAKIILEIGPGVGNFFDRLRKELPPCYFEYKCRDIFYPPTCIIPEELRLSKEELGGLEQDSHDVVYCVNVMQHMDDAQKLSYIKMAHHILRSGGQFILSLFVGGKPNCEDNRSYCYHFGQLTYVPLFNEILDKFHEVGFQTISYTCRFDGMTSFILIKP